MNAQMVPRAAINPSVATIYIRMLFFFFPYLLEICLKWPSSPSLSVKTAIFTQLKSLLKPRDKSCSARHTSHCQKRGPSVALLLCLSLVLVSLPLLKAFHLRKRPDKTRGNCEQLRRSGPVATMARSHMEATLGGRKLFHIWQMFTVYQRLCR